MLFLRVVFFASLWTSLACADFIPQACYAYIAAQSVRDEFLPHVITMLEDHDAEHGTQIANMGQFRSETLNRNLVHTWFDSRAAEAANDLHFAIDLSEAYRRLQIPDNVPMSSGLVLGDLRENYLQKDRDRQLVGGDGGLMSPAWEEFLIRYFGTKRPNLTLPMLEALEGLAYYQYVMWQFMAMYFEHYYNNLPDEFAFDRRHPVTEDLALRETKALMRLEYEVELFPHRTANPGQVMIRPTEGQALIAFDDRKLLQGLARMIRQPGLPGISFFCDAYHVFLTGFELDGNGFIHRYVDRAVHFLELMDHWNPAQSGTWRPSSLSRFAPGGNN